MARRRAIASDHISDRVKSSAGRDILAGATVVAAIVMFAGSTVDMLVASMRTFTGNGGTANHALATTVLLNIALILFSWRRYRDVKLAAADKIEAEQRADELQSRDLLTGLLNRNGLANEATELTQRGERRHRSTMMVMIDIDCFKNINDVHGHATGDLVLKAVADRIIGVVPTGSCVGRIGGDEFAVMFNFDGTATETVDLVAVDLVKAISRPFDINGTVISTSASVGLARSDLDGSTFDLLMRRGNIAMNTAKRRGKNRSVWFDASMERELRARNDIEQGLRDGIPKGQFVPFFEKQIDLKSGKLRGFEVLARWEHPINGIISPDVFIPVAEETGMIGDLSMSVMRQAFEQAKSWDPELTLSVNIAPGQLKDPWLAHKILKLLVDTGFPPSRLEIEITESSLFENLSLAQSIIGSLKNQGVRLALDDFGTGYSSLAHLRSLPFDRIKIDKSFVMSMNENKESAAIVNAIARLGDSLSLTITAEGIEDMETLDSLKAIGCAKGQGWHYGKPLSGAQVAKYLTAPKDDDAPVVAETSPDFGPAPVDERRFG